MKTPISLVCVCLFALCALGAAQDAPKSLSCTKTRKLTITGMVSNDGKTIRGEQNTAWIVTNAEKLHNFLGHQVSVKGTLDPLTNQLRVLSVKMAQEAGTYSSRIGDSAFRR
jgi:hypothetical protein